MIDADVISNMRRSKEQRLTASRLRELFDFDPLTGLFARKIALTNKVKSTIGLWVPGWMTQYGYCALRLEGGAFLAHRLAWLHVHGEWPSGQIDHINGARTDNRIENLRVVTNAVNQTNLSPASSTSHSKVRGAHWNSRLRKFQSQVEVAGKRLYLGLFDTAEQAHQAYVEARRQHGIEALRSS
jgi:hypothetical protein